MTEENLIERIEKADSEKLKKALLEEAQSHEIPVELRYTKEYLQKVVERVEKHEKEKGQERKMSKYAREAGEEAYLEQLGKEAPE